MRHMYGFILAAALIALGAVSAQAQDYGTTTSFNQTINVVTHFNAYGVAVHSTSVTTTSTVTTGAGGEKSYTTSTTTVESTWHGGSLKANTAYTTSKTTDPDGSVSTTQYTDSYKYDSSGRLASVSGSGTTVSYDENGKLSSQGTITRSFTVKNNQALLTQSVTSGNLYENGVNTGTFNNTTNYAYEYKGGSWVVKTQVSTSTTQMKSGDYTQITRTTTYQHNDYGVITGISQTASGTQIRVMGQNGSQQAKITYAMVNYQATASFHAQQGWYISMEKYQWQMQ